MRMIINICALRYYNCDNSLSLELVKDVVEQSYLQNKLMEYECSSLLISSSQFVLAILTSPL